MNRYEVIYIIDAQMEDNQRQELIARFNTLVESNGGTIDKIDEWGKRRLAYTIDYKNDGYYVLMHITAAPEFPRELERNFDNNENIIRYLTVKIVEKRSNVKPRKTPLRPAQSFAQGDDAQPVVAPTPSPMPEITEPVAKTAPAAEATAESAPEPVAETAAAAETEA